MLVVEVGGSDEENVDVLDILDVCESDSVTVRMVFGMHCTKCSMRSLTQSTSVMVVTRMDALLVGSVAVIKLMLASNSCLEN